MKLEKPHAVGRIKPGAVVWCDMRRWSWPEMPHGRQDLTFAIYPAAREHVNCVRVDFGVTGRNRYGNGSVYVPIADIDFLGSPSLPFLGEGI